MRAFARQCNNEYVRLCRQKDTPKAASLFLDSARRARDSAKTILALDMIDELIAEGRRILVFSSFTSMLTILERELAARGAHRIGQDKPVFVDRLVTVDTVEARIVKMQQRKRDLADAMIEGGDGASLSALSVEETLALFESE